MGVQRAQLVALARARLALLRQLRLLPAQRRLLLPDQRALLAHLLPRLQHPHLQLCALPLRPLQAQHIAVSSWAMQYLFFFMQHIVFARPWGTFQIGPYPDSPLDTSLACYDAYPEASFALRPGLPPA